jgi:hypothetical protein
MHIIVGSILSFVFSLFMEKFFFIISRPMCTIFN